MDRKVLVLVLVFVAVADRLVDLDAGVGGALAPWREDTPWRAATFSTA